MDTLIPSIINGVTALLCLSLAVVVLARNHRKLSHQTFALLAFNQMLWTLGVVMVINSDSVETAYRWIVFTEIVACFIPATCYHFTGYFPSGEFEGNRRIRALLYLVAFALAAIAPTELYVKEVTVIPLQPPQLVHGPVYVIFLISIVTAVLAIHTNMRRKLRETTGQSRRQIHFVLMGIYFIGGVGLFTNVLAEVFGTRMLQAYGPLAVALLMGTFAYAMIRFHLLDTRVLASRVIVILLSTSFVLVTVYGFTSIVQFVLKDPVELEYLAPTLLAAVTLALIFPQVKARIQGFVEGRIIRKSYDINRLYRQIAEQASEEVNLQELLRNVADHIRFTVGVKVIRVYLLDENDPERLNTVFTTVKDDPNGDAPEHGALISYLRRNPRPLLLERILHEPDSAEIIKIAEHLAELDAYFCLPLKTSEGLVGILTLGQKQSRDVYSEEEVMAFRALAGPLGTAIANAQLYEELESVNLHLSRVLGQMREGVVAVDSHGIITTINDSAAKFMGDIEVGQSLDALPPEVAEVLRASLSEQRAISDFDTTIPGPDGLPVPVIMSASWMHTHGHDTTGAVALIYDLSQVKRLEQNVVRADRLSSIGVLAAGMAHEIKNPLVSIKTFSQLLLKRYQDPDFRDTFKETVPGEVDRINSIVSRLLDFAKPRPVEFKPQRLKRIIDQVLALTESQIRKANVLVRCTYPDEDILVIGDEQQLHQVFLNLILNAVDAIRDEQTVRVDRRIRITVEIGHAHFRKGGVPSVIESECVRVSITDTGSGITQENLNNLFTPFFTTKAEGCGLGLSVVHGIISEHGGEIDVTSTPGQGTTFTVVLPMAQTLAVVDQNERLFPV